MTETHENQIAFLRHRLEGVCDRLEDIKDQKQQALDGLPEALQESEHGDKILNKIDSLDSAYDYIFNAIELLEAMNNK